MTAWPRSANRLALTIESRSLDKEKNATPILNVMFIRCKVRSLDAGLVDPGSDMDLYVFPGSPPEPERGVAFNLWNNLWSVNYIFWYPFEDADRSFGVRFSVDIPMA